VAEHHLLVLGAELEDVDWYGGVGRLARHEGPLSVAPRRWVTMVQATRGG
jgi:hypothetical protein